MKNLIALTLITLFFQCNTEKKDIHNKDKHPNVVILYADDMGVGDVGFMNPKSKIPTPEIDALAAEGIHFTDAHSPSSICSPSRYGILTGRYSWRTGRIGNPGVGDPHLIKPARTTLASLFRDQGYDAACIGKWGLGAAWDSVASKNWKRNPVDNENIDFKKHLPIGETNGFTYDYVFLWFSTNPNGKVWDPKYSENPTGSGGWRESTCWFYENGYTDNNGDVDFLKFDWGEAQMRTVKRSVAYIDAKGAKSKDNNFNQKEDAPFFLYTALHVPHGPYFVNEQFIGKSNAGLYGDYVCQLDWSVGQLKAALKRNGMLENTIFIFTADNGVDPNQYKREKKYNHISRGEKWNGGKGKAFEGGHRMPFVISGKGIEPGSVSNQMISQLDLLATFADMFGVNLDDNAGEDSFSFLPVLEGNDNAQLERNSMIHEAFFGGYRLGIRHNTWVYLRETDRKEAGLFNLEEDSRQEVNLIANKPEKAAEMEALLVSQIEAGRTR